MKANCDLPWRSWVGGGLGRPLKPNSVRPRRLKPALTVRPEQVIPWRR